MTGPAESASADGPAFLAITGTTTSGKTALSVEVARLLDGEIVSMDSRQVYRRLDIGTDKVEGPERAAVPHHGLDLVDPTERYSAGRFAREARGWVAEILGRGRVPILVGGTGFFLKAVLEPVFREPELDEDRLVRIRSYLRKQPPERLAAWVRRLDPERADLAVEGGPQRMGRTLEVALLSGRALSEWHRTAPPDGEALDGVVVLLDVAREVLDARIDARVGRMVECGFVDEVRGLLESGVPADAPGMTATGYREVVRHLRGECTLEEALEDMRRDTRRYARRQLTWFRNQLPGGTRVVDATIPVAEQVEAVLDAWRAGGGTVPGERTEGEGRG